MTAFMVEAKQDLGTTYYAVVANSGTEAEESLKAQLGLNSVKAGKPLSHQEETALGLDTQPLGTVRQYAP